MMCLTCCRYRYAACHSIVRPVQQVVSRSSKCCQYFFSLSYYTSDLHAGLYPRYCSVVWHGVSNIWIQLKLFKATNVEINHMRQVAFVSI